MPRSILKSLPIIIAGVLVLPNLFLVSFAETPISSQGSAAAADNAAGRITQSPEDKIISLVCGPGSTVETKSSFEKASTNLIKAGSALTPILAVFRAASAGIKIGMDPKKSVNDAVASIQEPIACSRPATSKSDCDISRGEQPLQIDGSNWKCYTAPISITRAGGAKIIGIQPYKSIIPIPCQNLPGISNLNCAADYSTPAQYVLRIYQFALLLVGMAAFGQIVFGGLEYILAAGSFTKIDSAKGRIKDALSGLLLLLGAYFVLFNINPDLVTLREPAAEIIDTRQMAAEAEQNLIKNADIFTGGSGGDSEPSSGDPLCKISLNTGLTVNTNIRFDGIQYQNPDDTVTQLAKPREISQPPKSICQQCKSNAGLESDFGSCKCDAGFVQVGSECVQVPTSS